MIKTQWIEQYYKPVRKDTRPVEKGIVQQEVLAILAEGAADVDEIEARSKFVRSTLYKNLRRMKIEGLVVRRHAGVRKGCALYKWSLA